jgi:5-methylcytosine-specific restriction endonuclease McrA
MMNIVTRTEALASGLSRYFTGKPCPKGHVAERHVSNWGCVECTRLHSLAWISANPEPGRARARAWQAANPEKKRERQRAWRAANPEKIREWGRAWKTANRKRESERIRARYAANPELAREQARARRAANPEMARAQVRNSRARRRAAEGSHTAADIARIIEAQGYKCALCRKSVKKKYHVDHILALVNGGANWPSNLQILCPSCNCSKGAKDPIDFAREMGKLL